MKSANIKFNLIEDITKFVTKAMEVDGEILVSRGIYTIDGKSLLGVMSLDPSKGFTVTYPDSATDFANFLTTLHNR